MTIQTPWGLSQDREIVAEGLEFVSTASHGGINVSQERNKQIPDNMKNQTFNQLGESGWYEEDCDWCIPVIVFNQEFSIWANSKGWDGVAYIEEAQRVFTTYADLVIKESTSCQYWIKTHLHKDGTAQWDGVIGQVALNEALASLKSLGYKPTVDHAMTEWT